MFSLKGNAATSARRFYSLILAVSFLLAACFFLLTYNYPQLSQKLLPTVHPHPETTATSSADGKTAFPNNLTPEGPTPNLAPAVACRGPRGHFLDDPLSDDLPRAEGSLRNVSAVDTTLGSWEAIGLEQTWMSIDQRYGPYGYNEDASGYQYSSVNWSSVNWGQLQDDCYVLNRHRFSADQPAQVNAQPRFRSVADSAQSPSPRRWSGRQAIVLRTWSTYKYQPEDFHNLRALITEASLATGGEYAVFLLVDVKKEDGARIHQDAKYYREVVEESVPKEFWDIAVLFHNSLQLNWYPKVDEVRPIWQIMQPFQLFGHFYPEFDHFWQIEMDTRFTGDAGKMLQAFHTFGKSEPYKQARERASWNYTPRIHGTYQDLCNEINKTLHGGATVWGPIRIKNFEPIGPTPPTQDPKDDQFEWGVGREADLLLLNPLNDVLRFKDDADWVFRNWHLGGFDAGVPRFMGAPAQGRASWELLEATHLAQKDLGLAVPSEATLPSFALWHGLKVVGVPVPKYQYPERDIEELDFVVNGGPPSKFPDGIANGGLPYRSSSLGFFVKPRTWDWWSSLCDVVFDQWMKTEHENTARAPQLASPDGLPHFMKRVDGKTYAPNLIMHPRKTNGYRSPE